MGTDYITVEEAAERFGLHPKSLNRLLITGRVRGFKATVDGRRRWLVSVRSVQDYTDPGSTFSLLRPGPKLHLRRVDDDSEDQ